MWWTNQLRPHWRRRLLTGVISALLALGCHRRRVSGHVDTRTSDAFAGRSASLPAGTVHIPPGEFEMGDHSGAGYRDEQPAHRVYVSAFYLDKTEVSWGLWGEVCHWALTNGYQFDASYDFHPNRAGDRPVCNVSWYDAVKWANARSEKNRRVPVYYTDARQTSVYRVGRIDLAAEAVNWSANGFRLPTEAEWERAARGGLAHQHYPWPSAGTNFSIYFDGSKANFWQSGDPFESDADCATTPVGYFNGAQTPLGTDMANGYGLYDMAGNVEEWCWDWYHDQWYAEPAAGGANPKGPAAGYGRVLRGGSWISSDKYCRVAARYVSAPSYRCHCYGVRLVISGP